jgi:hypothetical protein
VVLLGLLAQEAYGLVRQGVLEGVMLRETLEVTLKFLQRVVVVVVDRMQLQRHSLLEVLEVLYLVMRFLEELELRELRVGVMVARDQPSLGLTFIVVVVVEVVEVQSQQMVVMEVLVQTMVVVVVEEDAALSVLLRVQEEQERMGLLWLQHISNYERI